MYTIEKIVNTKKEKAIKRDKKVQTINKRKGGKVNVKRESQKGKK